MKKLLLMSLLLVMAVIFSSCSGSYTEISGTWKKPSYSGKKFNKILVVAISNDIVKRSTVENALVSELKYEKINATASQTILDFTKVDRDNNGRVDSTKRGEVQQMLIDGGYDGAIVLSLLDVKEKTEYVPGQTYYQPAYYGGYGGYYGGFYGYSYNTYGVVSTPGYYVETKNVYIETRLFDIKKDEMVWASKTETLNVTSLKESSNSLSKALVDTMLKDNIVK